MRHLLIKNAKIATSQKVFEGSVLCEDSVITQIFSKNETLPDYDADTIDALGCYLLPGGVDPHTHFDLDIGYTRASDDFYTGGVAAACGGTTTIIDHMAFGPKGAELTHQPKVYAQLAKPCVIDYGFHGIIQHVNEQVLADMATLKNNGITSLKLYLTYDDMIDDDGIFKVLLRAKQLGITICAHCENNAAVNALRASYVSQGLTQPKYHALSRPPQAEAEAVFRFLMLAKIAGSPKAYIVHLTSKLGLEALTLARKSDGENIFAETCPQYLFCTDELYNNEQEGLKYIMSPPLRTQSDTYALWQALAEESIQTIGTDHCPFFFATQKQRGKDNFTLCPNGAPGVQLRMQLLFSEGFMKSRISLPQLVRLCCTNPAKIFGISQKKGDIAVGADADFVIIDPGISWQVTKAELCENVDYTPYEGFKLKGKIKTVISRGETIVTGEHYIGKKGRGQFLHRV